MALPSDTREHGEVADKQNNSPSAFAINQSCTVVAASASARSISLITLITAVGIILPKKEGSPNNGMYKRYAQHATDAYYAFHPSFGLPTRGYSFLKFLRDERFLLRRNNISHPLI